MLLYNFKQLYSNIKGIAFLTSHVRAEFTIPIPKYMSFMSPKVEQEYLGWKIQVYQATYHKPIVVFSKALPVERALIEAIYMRKAVREAFRQFSSYKRRSKSTLTVSLDTYVKGVQDELLEQELNGLKGP